MFHYYYFACILTNKMAASERMPEEKKNVKVLMVGLDMAGKTTILYRLKQGRIIPTIPSLGYNNEVIEYKGINFVINDVGGLKSIRPLWMHYMEDTHVIIYVVDSSDRERIEEAREEMVKLLARDEVENNLLLIYANKQDLPDAMNIAEIMDKLGLHSLEKRKWYIQSLCTTSGDGLHEGLDWLLDELEHQKFFK